MSKVKSQHLVSDSQDDLFGRIESVLEMLRNTGSANTDGYKILAVLAHNSVRMTTPATVIYEATIFYEVSA